MILALGTVTVDTIEVGARSYLPRIGGSALYFAAAAAPLFSRVRVVGVVGDEFPTAQLVPLASAGIDLDGLRNAVGPSQSWHARYLDAGNVRETIHSDRSILTAFNPLLNDYEASANYVFLGSIHPTAQRSVLNQISGLPTAVVMLDSMSHWIDAYRSELLEDLARVDILVATEAEICQWSGLPEPDAGARQLLASGPACVVVKRGDEGATVVTSGGVLSGPAVTARTVDPTGAGDAFAGGFLASLATGGAGRSEVSAGGPCLRQALDEGLAAGARAVSGIGLEGLATRGDQPTDDNPPP